MKKEGILQIITSFLLVFVMLFGVWIPTQTVFAENKEVQVTITNFSITNSQGDVQPNGYFSNTLFKLDYKWDVSDHENGLQEGDYFEVELPNQFKFPPESSYCNFDIKTPTGEVMARAVVMPQDPGGGKITVTFTSYVNDKFNIGGDVHLTARWNTTSYPVEQEGVYEIAVGSFNPKITLKPYVPTQYGNEILYKVSGQTLTNDGLVRWRIRINAKQSKLNNVIIKDTLEVEDPGSFEGIEYVAGEFVLHEIVFEDGKPVEKNPKNVSNEVVLSSDKRSFTYNMGNLDGKAYMLHYRSTYRQGLKLKNTVELTSTEIGKIIHSQFQDSESGGGGQGNLTSKIKIVKIDEENHEVRLKNAKFQVTRKATGASFELVTNENGEAVSMQLIPGDYKIKEIKAPDNYVLNNQEYTVTVTSDKVCLKEITNEPIRKNIHVEKMWMGGQWPDPITAILKANGTEVTRNKLSAPEWKHTFTGLRKYDEHGYEIQYTVEEEEKLPGYTTTYAELPNLSGETEQGLVIINTKNTIEVTVTKSWEGVTGEIPVIKLQLLKDGHAEGVPIELTNGTTTHKWTDLEKTDYNGRDYVYTVKEVGETNNNIQIGNNWYKVTYGGDLETGLTVTNKKLPPWTPMEPPVREIKVTKLWKNHNGKPITPPTDKIIVELYKDGNPTGKKEELNAGNNWIVSFKNLEVADGVGSTNYYKYTVKEVGEDGNTVKFDGKLYKVVYEGSMKDGFTITNEKEAPPTPPTPNTPSNPTPDKPEVPNNPTPNIPEIPNIPEVPNNPTPNIPEIPNIPEVPNKPTQNIPKTPNKPKIPNKTLPKTGNHSDISLYACLLLTSGSLLILLGNEKRKHAK